METKVLGVRVYYHLVYWTVTFCIVVPYQLFLSFHFCTGVLQNNLLRNQGMLQFFHFIRKLPRLRELFRFFYRRGKRVKLSSQLLLTSFQVQCQSHSWTQLERRMKWRHACSLILFCYQINSSNEDSLLSCRLFYVAGMLSIIKCYENRYSDLILRCLFMKVLNKINAETRLAYLFSGSWAPLSFWRPGLCWFWKLWPKSRVPTAEWGEAASRFSSSFHL